MRYPRFLRSLLTILICGSIAACAKATVREKQVESRTANAAGVKAVEIRNMNGWLEIVSMRSVPPMIKVTVTKWAKASSRATAKKALGKVRLRIHRDGDRALVLLTHPEDTSSVKYGAELRVLVPPEISLDADTGNGRIRVLGVNGRVKARTRNGRIEIRDARAAVKAETANGDVVASGRITSFELATNNGNVKVHLRRRNSLEDDSSATTKNGNVSLTLSRDFNAQLSARSRNGRLLVPFDGLASHGNTKTGKLGAGGKLLNLATDNGNIRILAKDYTRIRSVPQFREGMRYPRSRNPTFPMGHGHGHAH